MTSPLVPHFTLSSTPPDPDKPATELKNWTFRQISNRFGPEGARSLVWGHTVTRGEGHRFRVVAVEMLPSPHVQEFVGRLEEVGLALHDTPTTRFEPDAGYEHVETFRFPTLKEATDKVERILGSTQGGYAELKCYLDNVDPRWVVIYSSSFEF